MALEIINAIRGTEDEAQKIRLEAQEAAKTLTKTAAEKGEKLVADAEKAAREQSAKLLQEANEKAEGIVRSSEAAEKDEREKMRALSAKNMANAARFIIEELKRQ